MTIDYFIFKKKTIWRPLLRKLDLGCWMINCISTDQQILKNGKLSEPLIMTDCLNAILNSA